MNGNYENELKKLGFQKVSEHQTFDSSSNSVLSIASPFFENQLLGYKEAARYLSISEQYLRRLKSKGKMPYVNIGSRGIRFRIASLNSWIAEREVK